MLNIGGTDLIPLAIAHLEANGYRVFSADRFEELMQTKLEPVETDKPVERKARKTKAPKAVAPKLNCLGKPMNPLFDPNYKMKYRSTGKPAKGPAQRLTSESEYFTIMQAKHGAHWLPSWQQKSAD